MDFRIADTFTDSLARLTGEEQKLAKTTAFDLQMDPASPGMQFHRLSKSKDPNFWSVRVGSDLRLIVHKTTASLMLCYVDHHDAAYAWAERRKIERHPQTGAAQLVEVRETVREIVVPKYVEAAPEAKPAKRLFAEVPDWVFLSHGVPVEWMDDVRAATEETLFEVAEHLPREAGELLLNLATGAPLPRGPRRRPAERALLHRRPRPAHLPAALLLEVAGPRRSWPLIDTADQLPHVAPNPLSCRPAASSIGQ